MHGRKALLGIIVGVLVAALAGTAIASQTVKVDSKVTMNPFAEYGGQVKSSKHACEVQRTVKVFEHRPGADPLVGTDTSNSRGEWRFEVVPGQEPGFFYAKVLRRKEGTAGTTFVCRSDRSKTLDFH